MGRIDHYLKVSRGRACELLNRGLNEAVPVRGDNLSKRSFEDQNRDAEVLACRRSRVAERLNHIDGRPQQIVLLLTGEPNVEQL